MKYRHPIFKLWWLLVGAIVLFSSCQRVVHRPTTRTGSIGTRIAFNMQSALNMDQIAGALLTAESISCLVEISVLRGAADQFEIYTNSGAGFPTDGSSYLVMSSGEAPVVVPGSAATFLNVSQSAPEGLLPTQAGGSPNGVHTTNDRASLRVKLSVPSDATTLSFDWKFGSEEPPSYYQRNYQDYFTVILNSNLPPVEVTWVDHNIGANVANLPGGSSFAPSPPLPNPNNTIYNSTNPSVQTRSIDVIPFQGMTVTLDFHIADASDTYFDSGVFLDNLGFDTSCEKDQFEYAAKLVCGPQKDPKDMRLARGFYATSINIHNPNDSDVTFYKKLALSYPPEEQKPGKIIPISTDILAYDEALKVDCMDIQKRLFPSGFLTYIEGFVVIQSSLSLDVTAVYTTASLDKDGNVTNHSSIDVEQIRERKTKTSTPPEVEREDFDHFMVYDVDPIQLDTVLTVFLKGQFDNEQFKAGELRAITHFANPTGKTHPGAKIGIKDSSRHFNWYALEQEQPEPRRTINFRNQFGQRIVQTQDPQFLLVPAQKISDQGSVFPDSLDHYKCYEIIEVSAAPNPPVVTLDDQFGTEKELKVGTPLYFCVPVEKEWSGASSSEVVNDFDHLVVYDIPLRQRLRSIDVLDQFGVRTLHVTQSVMLAVPTEKLSYETQED